LQRRLEGEDGCRAADRTAGGGQQGGIAVELHQLHAGPGADGERAHHHQYRLGESGQADLGDFLQADPQAEERDGDTQQFACREVDAGRPARGHAVAQRIAIQRGGEQGNEQDAVELSAGGGDGVLGRRGVEVSGGHDLRLQGGSF
jgi:hypothetical protein